MGVGVEEVGLFRLDAVEIHGEDRRAADAVGHAAHKGGFAELPGGSLLAEGPAPVLGRDDRGGGQGGAGEPGPVPDRGDVVVFFSGAGDQADAVGEVAAERIVPVGVVFDRPDPIRVHPERRVPVGPPVDHHVGVPEVAVADEGVDLFRIAFQHRVVGGLVARIGGAQFFKGGDGAQSFGVSRRFSPS